MISWSILFPIRQTVVRSKWCRHEWWRPSLEVDNSLRKGFFFTFFLFNLKNYWMSPNCLEGKSLMNSKFLEWISFYFNGESQDFEKLQDKLQVSLMLLKCGLDLWGCNVNPVKWSTPKPRHTLWLAADPSTASRGVFVGLLWGKLTK